MMPVISERLLAGKRALVTGASSGLGAHLAEVLVRNGADVIIAARRVDALHETESTIAKFGSVTALPLDLRDSESCLAAVQSCGAVDILVNNAGVVREGAALTQTEKDWDDVLDTNLKGQFFLSQAFAARMKDNGGGTIINIASILGLRQTSGVLPYSVSKAAVVQLTKALALEWARHGIRINALAPGYFDTELNREFWNTDAGIALVRRIPQRRLGELGDLDGPFLLLASDVSRYMTGAVLPVDGGHLVSGL